MKKTRRESNKQVKIGKAAAATPSCPAQKKTSYSLASGKQRLINKVASKLAQDIITQNLRAVARKLPAVKGGNL